MAPKAGLIYKKGNGGKGGSGEGINSGNDKASGEGGDGDWRKGGNILAKRKVGGDRGSDEESRVLGTFVLGTHGEGEGRKKTTFERKARSCSQGIYGTKPDMNSKPTVHFASKTSIAEPAAKRTLGFIAKSNWDENTVTQTMAEREPYFNVVIKAFKEYYKYPEGSEDIGDSVVKEHLKRNLKSYLNKMKERLDKAVGYTDKDIDWDLYRPHYFAPRAWNSVLTYWKLPQFKKRSDNGKEARKQVEIPARSGAMPYSQRRMKLDAEREVSGLMPLTNEEFLDYVYNPTEPAVIALKEKIKMVRDSQPELSTQIQCDGQPLTLETQKEIQRKDILVLLQARPPKKGKVILHPHETVAQLVGVEEAAKYNASSQKMKDSPTEVDSNKIYEIIGDMFEELSRMVSALPVREVTQSMLDVEVHKLATATFPDPDQNSLRSHYVLAAMGLLRKILKDKDKVLVEVIELEKETSLVVNTGSNEGQDEDPYADNFPL